MSQNIRNNGKLQKRSNWTSKRAKWWVMSQNIQNYAKLRKWSNYNELHRFDVKTIKNVELRRKPFKTAKLQKWSKYNDFQRFDVKNFKTTQNCKSNEITMNCIDITSKWSKMLLCRKTFETTENYKSVQIGRQNEQNDELCRKTFKTTQNYESNQNTMTCIDLMSKRSIMTRYVEKHSKQCKTAKVIKLQWIGSI